MYTLKRQVSSGQWTFFTFYRPKCLSATVEFSKNRQLAVNKTFPISGLVFNFLEFIEQSNSTSFWCDFLVEFGDILYSAWWHQEPLFISHHFLATFYAFSFHTKKKKQFYLSFPGSIFYQLLIRKQIVQQKFGVKFDIILFWSISFGLILSNFTFQFI